MHDVVPKRQAETIAAERGRSIRVLMITSEYPTPERPAAVPFIVRQEQFLKRRGIEVDLFAFNGKQRFLNYVSAWRGLRKFTAGKEYDLLHAQWGHSAALALPKRLPWVITFRGNDLEGIVGSKGRYTLKGKILTAVAKRMGSLADECIVVSESLGRRLNGKEFTVIPSGLDLELFRPLPRDECREKLGLPNDKKLALFAASTIENPRKRFGLAKAAVKLLEGKHDVRIIVANKVDHSQIPVYMSACDVLLLTSMHEGSPNVVKEALACNLPVVSVDVGDVRERLNGVSGCRLCTDDSPTTIAAALDEVLSSGSRTNGRDFAETLDENNITDQVIRVYRRILERNFANAANTKKEVVRSS